MTKHTPGPWLVTDRPPYRLDDGGTGIFIHTPHGLTVAVCDVSKLATDDELRANARVMAAAPKMLALLQDAERHCGVVDLPALRAVVAMATGVGADA